MPGWTAIDDFILDQVFGFQTANIMKDRDLSLASSRPYFLGGSRVNGIQGAPSALRLNVYDYLDFELDGDQLANITVQVRVEVRTAAGGTSVTPVVYNVTDDADEATGDACTDTEQDYSQTNQKQTLTWTPASGVKTYRVVVDAGDENAEVFAIAHLELVGADL